MIIVELKGGLGNQLFQYAAGLSLGKHHGVPVKVDVTALQQPDEQIGTFRNYELCHLQTPPEIANQLEIMSFLKDNFLIKYVQKARPSYRRKIYNEKSFYYDPNFWKAGKNIYLKGHRQSEKYFKRYAKNIRQVFELKEHLVEEVQDFATDLSAMNSVSVHIRRGDYLRLPIILDWHGVLGKDFYFNAISLMSSRIQDLKIFYFSDDVDWVKKELIPSFPGTIVSESISKSHYHDFYLMGRCKHHIIANSSFSWWAAWLNPNPGKIVIAPHKWFNNAPYDTRDLIPPEWLRV